MLSVLFVVTAAKEQGFKIMAMLYLTPVIPLGLVSYMCGTTSMNIYAFALAKIFALPLYLIYTFMGASAHSFVKRRGAQAGDTIGISASDHAKQLEENRFLLLSGLFLSVVMMTLITKHIRKELMKVRTLLPVKCIDEISFGRARFPIQELLLDVSRRFLRFVCCNPFIFVPDSRGTKERETRSRNSVVANTPWR